MSDKKGGYRLVSLKLIELSTMTACAGLYQAIESSHDKPLCLCDILVSGAKKNNVYITAIKGTNKYTLKHIYGYNLEVTNEDVVTISQDSEGIELPVPEASDDGKIVGVNVQGKYVLKPSVEDQIGQVPSGTIQDVLGLDNDGKLVKGAVSGGGTKFYLHDLYDDSNNHLFIINNNEQPIVVTYENYSYYLSGKTLKEFIAIPQNQVSVVYEDSGSHKVSRYTVCAFDGGGGSPLTAEPQGVTSGGSLISITICTTSTVSDVVDTVTEL